LAGWRRMMAFSGVTSQCEERGFRRSAGTNFEIAIAVVPAGTKDDWLLVSESYFLFAPLELGTVDPDAMQNDSELAGDSGLGLLDANTFGQPHTPSFQD
jgi:hypothetical protein